MEPNATQTASKSNEDLAKAQQHGLTTIDGRSIIENRKNPLTENELTAIASKLLLKSPHVSLPKKKNSDGEGSEEVSIEIWYRDNLKIELLDSALRKSPSSANLSHLTRLSVHKKLGSTENDRALLLHDYANSVEAYSDFVVYLSCKCIWEQSESPFYPTVKIITEVCEEFHRKFTSVRNNFGKVSPPKKEFNRADYYNDPRENPLRQRLCDFLTSVGMNEFDYFSMVNTYSNYQLWILACHKGWTEEYPE